MLVTTNCRDDGSIRPAASNSSWQVRLDLLDNFVRSLAIGDTEVRKENDAKDRIPENLQAIRPTMIPVHTDLVDADFGEYGSHRCAG